MTPTTPSKKVSAFNQSVLPLSSVEDKRGLASDKVARELLDAWATSYSAFRDWKDYKDNLVLVIFKEKWKDNEVKKHHLKDLERFADIVSERIVKDAETSRLQALEIIEDEFKVINRIKKAKKSGKFSMDAFAASDEMMLGAEEVLYKIKKRLGGDE